MSLPQHRNYEDTNVYARALQQMAEYLKGPAQTMGDPEQVATGLLAMLRDDGIRVVDPTAADDDGENVTMTFDNFSLAIAGFEFSTDLWEDHLDQVVTTLRQFDLYPLDEDAPTNIEN